jgi:hypothetical protein
MTNFIWGNPKPPLKQEGSFYDQYWFTIKTPKYNFYPNSSEGSDCSMDSKNNNKPSTVTNYGFSRCCPSECMKNSGDRYELNTRYVAITIPKNIDFSKKYKWILNLDFNLQGYTSDWACSDEFFTPQLGGLPGGMLEDPYVEPNGTLCEANGVETSPRSKSCSNNAIRCFDAKIQGIENFFKYLKLLVTNNVVLVHTSQIFNDLYYNRDCSSKDPCAQCWYDNNPDEQYFKVLFEMIYNNNYTDLSQADINNTMLVSSTAKPKIINDLINLKLDYNNMAILGYSVGAGAVSRYFNEFPLLKTINNNPFPQIKLGIMIGGGSYLCYSLDCKNDPECKVNEKTSSGIGGDDFNPCVNPNVCSRGCCPTNIAELNYTNGKLNWINHPPVILMQSINDYLADRNASLYYYNVLKKNNVPVVRLTANTNVHGLASEKSQINPSIPFLNKYFGTTIPVPPESQPPKPQPPQPPKPPKPSPQSSSSSSKNICATAYIMSIIISSIILFAYVFLYISKNIKLELNYLILFPIISIAVLIISIILLSKKKIDEFTSEDDKYFENLYNNIVEINDVIFEKNPTINGVLVHLFGDNDLDAIINQKSFEFNLNSHGVCDCSSFSAKTCSAWTYLRKDLPPILYNFPSSPAVNGGYWTPIWGVVLDANKAWPLITTMGVTDSDTFGRNQLSIDPFTYINLWDKNGNGNFNDGSRCSGDNTYTPFFTEDQDSNLNPVDKKSVDIVIQSSTGNGIDKRNNTSCGYGDDISSMNCRYINAGGGIQSAEWLYANQNLYGWDCAYNDNGTGGYGMPGSIYRPQGNFNGKGKKTKGCYVIEIKSGSYLNEDDKTNVANELGITKNEVNNLKVGLWKPSNDCYASKYPFLCVSNENPSTIDNTAYPNNWIKPVPSSDSWGSNASSNLDGQYIYIQDAGYDGWDTNSTLTGFNGSPTGRLNMYVGNKSKKYSKMFWDYYGSSNTSNPISIDNLMTPQCKFEKKDMHNWIYNIKQYWNYIYSTFNGFSQNKQYRSIGNTFSSPMCGNDSECEDSTYWNFEGCVDGNSQAEWNSVNNGNCILPQYLYGHPSAGTLYYENEVNIYNDPKQSDNSEQNKIFRDSIIGFIVIPKTCEDYMKIFKTGTCLPTSSAGCEDKYTYGKPHEAQENYTQRCSGYQCSQLLTNPTDKTSRSNICDNSNIFKTYGDVHDAELTRIIEIENKCRILLNLFNSKYRNNLYKAKLYHCFPSSNTLQDYDMLNKLFNNNINWSDVFKEI